MQKKLERKYDTIKTHLKSPKLYNVLKLNMSIIVDSNYNVVVDNDFIKKNLVKQGDNALFQKIREISGVNSDTNKYVIFVECKNYKNNHIEMRKIVSEGFVFNGIKYVLSEKSASMSRQGIIMYVRESISKELEEAITMGAIVKETVLAKYLSYRGLFLSSSFDLPNYRPYTIVVPDYKKTIKNQRIVQACDVEKSFVNEKGELITYKEKSTEVVTKDVDIEPFDGCGVMSHRVVEHIKDELKLENRPSVVIIRAPYIKGLLIELNFVDFYESRGVYEIEDIWGKKHSIYDVDIILTKSQYKGFAYFQKYGDYRDFEYYWEMFDKYNHSFRVAKWNFTFDEEPQMTKINYQILQTQKLDKEKFLSLADYSKEWIEKVITNKDKISTLCFLGLKADGFKPSTSYMKAILKNPEMLKDPMVIKYIRKLLKKNIDMMKTGKLYIKGSFKFLVSDPVALLEYIGGLEVNGVLEDGEFYAKNINGAQLGLHTIYRNPHICRPESRRLNGVSSDVLDRLVGDLSNVCIVNHKSLILPSLNGADTDGDLVLVVKNDVLLSSSYDKELPIVMDIDDKITAIKKEVNKENIVESTIMSLVSLVGELSNVATKIWSKVPKTEEEEKRYNDYVNLLSIIVGKSIDYQKTNVLWLPPKYIQKNAGLIPYFMKYISPYYASQKKFSMSPCNMNLLAWDIEKWERSLNYNQLGKSEFNYKIMIDENIPWDNEKYLKIKALYQEFQEEFKELKNQQRMTMGNLEYYNYFNSYDKNLIENTDVDWKACFEVYKKKAREICPNEKELANYAVVLCYAPHEDKDGKLIENTRDKNFTWVVAENGILENIIPVEHYLPKYDIDGEYEYLGKKYSLIKYKYSGNDFEEEFFDVEDGDWYD